MGDIIVENLSKDYVLKTGFIKQLRGKAETVSAVNDVSLVINEGEVLGLVGESGCGKTTLGKMLVKIESASSGTIMIGDKNIVNIRRKELFDFRKDVQMIFQDPYDSLDPKMTVYDIVAEPLRYLKLAKNSEDMIEKIYEMLRLVELSPPEQYVNRYPHRLSGGQRQRVAIARALIVNPKFVVADEPVSMLDVSIRAGILNLLQKLNRENGISILLITHDLATARFLSHRIAVMYLGKIVELISSNKLMEMAVHPYTKLLLSSAPDLFADTSNRIEIKGEAASATAPPKGCRFSPRCNYAIASCFEKEPELTEIEKDHFVACNRVFERE
ncbi:putative oligopeptide transport ATP-binding protein YkfD [[Clostridium] ultunense Esp]|uniref:Putative cell wall oligopeptide ABC transporter (ATP binding protein) n=1 Tax=[Clostridium] ultunense Esp TaxID=1288971 RepID=M1Z267_9FIRM|nr:ABC transporter ATP-binding protein [Schnuerera ultunensis]CCQ96960.1 putative oligopeptide transport ATP-binding protein YkfD [[Clostridium] ultunense Esp]SHD76484.1 putative cell wall oligopeptide ABC transporter (ATP binding protein) [[Clostridium] ultunense Esp]